MSDEEEGWQKGNEERLPQYFIRYVGQLVTRGKQRLACQEPKVAADSPPDWLLNQGSGKQTSLDKGDLPAEDHLHADNEGVLNTDDLVEIEFSVLGQSLSELRAEVARLGDLDHPDLTGLQLSQTERIRMKAVRKRKPAEEIEGSREQVEPEIFVQKILEKNGIVIFASSKCPFCSRLQYLFETHDKRYKIIRLDKMGEYGETVFQYLLNNWLEVKVPNLYFHGRHIEEEDLNGEIGVLNVLATHPATTDPTVYDLIILGGGVLGVEAALTGAGLRKKVCLIDCAERTAVTDGTCLNLDHMVKRYFHQTAADLLLTKEAVCYTWKTCNLSVNWPFLVGKVLENLRKADWEFRVRLRKAGVCFLNAKSLLLDKNTVEVCCDGNEKFKLRGRHVILAVDARAYVPQIPGEEHCITSSEVLLRPHPPGKVLVVGGSTLAVELAFILTSFGFPVTLMVSGHLLNDIDDEMAGEIKAKLKESGVEVLRDCLILRVEKLKDKTQKVEKRSVLRDSVETEEKTYLDSSRSRKGFKTKSETGQNTFDGKKKGKAKNKKAKKGKGKGNKKKKRSKKRIVIEPTESQKALLKKNTDLFRLIKKIITTKKLSGKYFSCPKRKRKPTYEGFPELGVIGLFGNGFIHSEVYNTVVIAAGQVTSTRSYGFSKAGIKVNVGSGKIITNEQDETSMPGVYAVGSIVEGKSHSLPTAISTAINLVQRLLTGAARAETVRKAADSLILTPAEYAWTGLTEERAKACFPGRVRVLRKTLWPLSSTFLEESSGKTQLKLITLCQPSKREEVIGIHMLGRNTTAAVLGLSVPMKRGLFLEDLDKIIPTEYTYTEELIRIHHKKPIIPRPEIITFDEPQHLEEGISTTKEQEHCSTKVQTNRQKNKQFYLTDL